MALQKTMEMDNGTSGNYIRISEVTTLNGSNQCQARVQLWKDNQTRLSGNKRPIEEYVITLETSGVDNVISQCYESLKQLPDFQNAIDV